MGSEARVFCTLFDRTYLARALVVQRTLSDHLPGMRLVCLCMDEASELLLRALSPRNTVVLPLRELESHDPGLAAVRSQRSAVEYCFTATPALCLYCLERFEALESITYIDADLMFFANPEPLFAEAAGSSILITPHRVRPGLEEWVAKYGEFNVQFLMFRRDDVGLEAIRWWRERCLEWCFNEALPDGRFGDQGYLNDWPQRFERVHVLRHKGGGLAPWNAQQYTLERTRRGVLVDGEPLIFHHYSGMQLFRRSPWLPGHGGVPRDVRVTQSSVPLTWATLPRYEVTEAELDLLWEPYLRCLGETTALVRTIEPRYHPSPSRIARKLRRVLPAPLRPA